MPASPESVPTTSMEDVNGIFKLVNDALTEAGTSAASAAGEVEEARRNARVASELARRFRGGGGGNDYQPNSVSDMIHARLPVRSGPIISTGFSPRRSFGVSPRSPYSSMNGGDNSHSHSSTPHSAGSTGFFRSRRKPPSLNGSSGFSVAAASHPPSGGGQLAARPNNQHNNMEEMVALTLELERTKQALEAEQMRHDESKSALQRATAKATQLEGQMGQVLNDMETQRETLGRRVDSLEHELAHAQMRLKLAEEDADMAFEIAKDNDQRREEAERLLPLAQQEINELKAQIATLSRTRATSNTRPRPPPPPPTAAPAASTQSLPEAADVATDSNKRASPKVVRFAENDDAQFVDAQSAMTESTSSTNHAYAATSPSSSSTRMDRSLVSSGREVLRQFAGGVNPLDVNELSIDVLAERRKRLQDRMKSMEGHMNGSPSHHSFSTTSSIPSFFSPMSSPLKDIETFLAASAESGQREAMIRGAVALLKASGRRLGLSGRWWSDAPTTEGASTPRKKGTPESAASFSTNASGSNNSSMALETLTRHYCTSVEVLIDRKQKEIVELESLCALWEQQEHDKDNGNRRAR